MKKVAVLGAGMVGSAIALDLSTTHQVTAVDTNKQRLDTLKKQYGLKVLQADLNKDTELKKAIKDADIVVGAVPGFMGFNTCKSVIESGKNMVDISFFPEDAMDLDKLAVKKNVTVVVDCGVAPGMDNILLGYHYQRMQVTDFVCMVGGLPEERNLPFQYKAPFSPIDVIEEYTRPARMVENFELITKPALSDPEIIHFEGIGSLEAFNTDGLRSLFRTMPVKNMVEKTLRYPGHRKLMENLRDMGFFSTEEITIKNQKITPLELLTQVLLPQWKLNPNEKEFTVMRVIISGYENHNPVTYTYDLWDKTEKSSGLSSMARTTGYTCAAVTQLILSNRYYEKGISLPEFLGKDTAHFNFIMQYLKAHKVIYKKTRH